jgi:predicted alpha/beta hydrolase family esterase
MKKQVVVIHGGDAHNSYKQYLNELRRERADKEDFLPDLERRWRDRLPEALGEGYEVFLPKMPNPVSAKYIEWKIWFDKLMPYLGEGPVFVGHSLGGIFLARYFAENPDKKKARAVMLVAPPFKDKDSREKIADFILPKDLSRLAKLGERLHIYASEDDPVVSFASFKKYAKLLPDAMTTIFKDRGHFRLTEFPEIVRDIMEAFA